MREANAFGRLCKGECFSEHPAPNGFARGEGFQDIRGKGVREGRMHIIRGQNGDCLQDIGGRTCLGEATVFETFGVGTICQG